MNRSEDLTGIALMVLGMAGFAVTDAFLKLLAGAIPLGQLLFIQGIGGALVFGSFALAQGARDWWPNFVKPVMVWRNITEMIAATSFLTALSLVPLSTLSSILQANPLLVTLGAALFLGAQVGPRRWIAIIVGLFGVLLVIQPWSARFDALALLCLIPTLALSARDLLTRQIPKSISTMQAATYGMAIMAPLGLVIMVVLGTPFVVPDTRDTILLGITLVTLPIGYWGVTAAMRVGDVAMVTPFRYSRIVFALILAWFIFGERPDALTWIGTAIIVASGLYTILREQRKPV